MPDKTSDRTLAADRPSSWVDELIAMTRPGIDGFCVDGSSGMDHYRVTISDNGTNAALHEAARTHGRSVEDEIGAIVRNSIAPAPGRTEYPAGFEPLPAESAVDHILRISRPGFDSDLPDRGLFELRDPYDDAG